MTQQIDPRLLNAVIQQESGGNPNAVSPVGAAGIMQIMPDTARDPGYGVTPLRGWDGVDPRTAPVEEQIRFGRDYLAAMQNRFGGDQNLTLAAYNAGPGAVEQYGGVPPFAETQNYVRSINAAAPQQQQPATSSDWRNRATAVQQSSNQQTTQSSSDWRTRSIPAAYNPGFVQRIKNVVQENENQMQRSADAYVAGEQSLPETMFQQSTAFASNVPDLLVEGLSTVTPDAVKELGMGAVRLAGKLPSFGGGTIGERLPGELQMIAENNPRLARNAQGVLDAASLVPAGKAVATGAKATGKTAAKTAARVTAPKIIPKTADDLKAMAQAAYQQADDIGAVFTPSQVGGKLGKSIDDLAPKPIAGKVLTSEDKLLLRHLDEYAGLNRASLSLRDVQRLDESLTQKITTSFLDAKTGLPDANGRKLMILQENLRKIVDDIPDNAANDALINGRRLWRAQTILRDLDAIAERASMSTNVGTSLRIGYKNLYNNKKRIRGWPKEAKEMLKKAATPGITDDALQLISSRLPAIIMGGTGNIAGAATAHTVGAAGRGLKAGIAARQGARVQQSIVDDAIGGLRPVAPQSDIPLMLMSPVATAGRGTPMTERQLNIARKKLNKTSKTSQTDDIIKLDDKTKPKKGKKK